MHDGHLDVGLWDRVKAAGYAHNCNVVIVNVLATLKPQSCSGLVAPASVVPSQHSSNAGGRLSFHVRSSRDGQTLSASHAFHLSSFI